MYMKLLLSISSYFHLRSPHEKNHRYLLFAADCIHDVRRLCKGRKDKNVRFSWWFYREIKEEEKEIKKEKLKGEAKSNREIY